MGIYLLLYIIVGGMGGKVREGNSLCEFGCVFGGEWGRLVGCI